MATVIQLLLPLMGAIVAKGHLSGPGEPYINHPNVPLHNMRDSKEPSNERPINGDIFSYNNRHDYTHFYRDGGYNPAMNMIPYFGYPGPFGMGNFDNMGGAPFGMPSIHNDFNIPGRYPPYLNVGDQKNPSEKTDGKDDSSGEEKHRHDKPLDNEQPDKTDDKPPIENQKLEDTPPKTNEVKFNDMCKEKNEGKKDNVNLNPKKDFLLVDNTGKGVYLLHESTPNNNGMVFPYNNGMYIPTNNGMFVPNNNGMGVPNNYPPAGNNVVYVPYNPQQPANPIYQVLNGQPATNIPLTPNRIGINSNVLMPIQTNPPPNSNNPSYVLIYANGQLIQIPGIVINPQQNNPFQNGNQAPHIVVSNPNGQVPNYMYANAQNQGNNPIVVQVPNNPNVAPVTNNVPTNGVYVQNPQTPTNYPGNNIIYPSNLTPQPSVPVTQPNNMGSGYTQPTFNNGNQGPGVNSINPNPTGPINNQGAQPALALPVNNNPNTYQPLTAQEKEKNAAIGAAVSPNLQPVGQPSPNDSSLNVPIIGAQPAVMVSGFKESDQSNKDSKPDKKEEKETKKEDKKKN